MLRKLLPGAAPSLTEELKRRGARFKWRSRQGRLLSIRVVPKSILNDDLLEWILDLGPQLHRQIRSWPEPRNLTDQQLMEIDYVGCLLQLGLSGFEYCNFALLEKTLCTDEMRRRPNLQLGPRSRRIPTHIH